MIGPGSFAVAEGAIDEKAIVAVMLHSDTIDLKCVIEINEREGVIGSEPRLGHELDSWVGESGTAKQTVMIARASRMLDQYTPPTPCDSTTHRHSDHAICRSKNQRDVSGFDEIETMSKSAKLVAFLMHFN